MKKYNVEFTTTITVFANDEDEACTKAASEMNKSGVSLELFYDYEEETEMEGHTYEVRAYDAWGNQEDGWEVNNSMVVGEVLIDDAMENDDVIDMLIEEGYLAEYCKGKVTYSEWGDGTFDIIQIDDDRPIIGLIRID